MYSFVMKSARIAIAAMLALVAGTALGQQTSTAPLPSGNTPAQRQKNAASATQDNSGTTGDQITSPPGAKGSTLIGCLTGPDKDGKYMLHNMAHRYGVQVMGPQELKTDSGGKVKLTGQWQPLPAEEQDKKSGETRRFQITDIEVMAAKCTPPSDTNPVSKNKKQKPTTYDAPSSDDASAPK